MFCILLANLRKYVKTPYNLLSVNEDFSGKHNNKITLLDSFNFYLFIMSVKHSFLLLFCAKKLRKKNAR